MDYPALVVELKWNKTVDTALKQIKEKKERDLYKDWYSLIKPKEEAASLLLYAERIRPMMDAQFKYIYGE